MLNVLCFSHGISCHKLLYGDMCLRLQWYEEWSELKTPFFWQKLYGLSLNSFICSTVDADCHLWSCYSLEIHHVMWLCTDFRGGGGDPNALQLKPRPLLCLACMQLHAALCRLVIAVIIFSHFLDLRINKIPYNWKLNILYTWWEEKHLTETFQSILSVESSLLP